MLNVLVEDIKVAKPLLHQSTDSKLKQILIKNSEGYLFTVELLINLLH